MKISSNCWFHDKEETSNRLTTLDHTQNESVILHFSVEIFLMKHVTTE